MVDIKDYDKLILIDGKQRDAERILPRLLKECEDLRIAPMQQKEMRFLKWITKVTNAFDQLFKPNIALLLL